MIFIQIFKYAVIVIHFGGAYCRYGRFAVSVMSRMYDILTREAMSKHDSIKHINNPSFQYISC